jgi:hypothetical protein
LRQQQWAQVYAAAAAMGSSICGSIFCTLDRPFHIGTAPASWNGSAFHDKSNIHFATLLFWRIYIPNPGVHFHAHAHSCQPHSLTSLPPTHTSSSHTHTHSPTLTWNPEVEV